MPVMTKFNEGDTPPVIINCVENFVNYSKLPIICRTGWGGDRG